MFTDLHGIKQVYLVKNDGVLQHVLSLWYIHAVNDTPGASK